MIGVLSLLWRRVQTPLAWCAITAIAACGAAAMSAAASEYPLAPGQTVVGELGRYGVKDGDVFPDVARRFDLGYTELVTANPGVDPWVPRVGRRLTIPQRVILPAAPRRGLILNLGQYRLFYFPPDGGRVMTFPVGIGIIGRNTPLGASRVVRKDANPIWYPPASIRAEEPDLPPFIPAGPDNPLGAFALYLGWPNYLIHGTNKPDGIGRNVSHGCIRLYPEDIAELFRVVTVGTPVRVVNQPTTAGWLGDQLYIQVYPSQAQTEEIDTGRTVTPDPADDAGAVISAVAGPYADAVDWQAVDRAAAERTGIPVLIATRTGYGPEASDSHPAVADGVSGPEPDAPAASFPSPPDTAVPPGDDPGEATGGGVLYPYDRTAVDPFRYDGR